MKKAILKADPNNAIATHVWNTGHKIQWNEPACVDRDVDWYRRRVKEALHIKNTPNAMNSDPGLSLGGVSNPPDQHIKERQLVLLFNLHCALDLLTEIVQMMGCLKVAPFPPHNSDRH